MSTPTIASRAPDATLEARSRLSESSCCSILIKTAITVAAVAAAAIIFSATLACASPLIGLIIVSIGLPLTAVFLSATWAGHTRYVTSSTRHYIPVRSSLYESARPYFFSEPASASRFGQPAAAFTARRMPVGMPHSFAAAPRVPVGGVNLGEAPLTGFLRASSPGCNVAVGSRH